MRQSISPLSERPANRPPSQNKPKQYKHKAVTVKYDWSMRDVTDLLDEGWEILRVDKFEEFIAYILRKEVE